MDHEQRVPMEHPDVKDADPYLALPIQVAALEDRGWKVVKAPADKPTSAKAEKGDD